MNERTRENPNDVSKKITSNYRIQDNFLPVNLFQDLVDTLLSGGFEWYHHHDKYNDELVYFNHMFYWNYGFQSKFHNKLGAIMERLSPQAIVQIRANLFNRTVGKVKEFAPMGNYNFPHKVLLYTINANDGYTKLPDGTKIYSRDNRAVFFETDKPYVDTSCTNDVFRMTLHFHYF